MGRKRNPLEWPTMHMAKSALLLCFPMEDLLEEGGNFHTDYISDPCRQVNFIYFTVVSLLDIFIMHLHVQLLFLLHTRAASMSSNLIMCFVVKYLSDLNSPSISIIQSPLVLLLWEMKYGTPDQSVVCPALSKGYRYRLIYSGCLMLCFRVVYSIFSEKLLHP